VNKKAIICGGLAAVAAAGVVYAQAARDFISIVGSSTVYPFATVVAEQFGKATQFKTPKIESTGSGGGIKMFCAGVGVEHPDITNSSRKIKDSEVEACKKNGVTGVIEVKVGFDGIAVANSKKAPHYNLTRKDLFLALAKNVPDSSGKLVPNPYKTWKEIDPNLPAAKIEVIGPPPTSGTRDAFVELVMEEGCKEFESIKVLEKSDSNAFKAACHTMREDGPYIEGGENDNVIVQKLDANPSALGIFGYSFLDTNLDKLQGSHIEGNEPTFNNIASGKYPVSRPLFMYVKKAHIGVIPGIEEYVKEFTSEKAWGEEGYLAEKGMIPLPEQMRKEVAANVRSMKTL
jgi:phosphate transport system substrate-binding protein